MIRKRKRTATGLDTSSLIVSCKTEQLRCVLIELLLRIGRLDDASALVTTAPRIRTQSNLAMILNRALILCSNNDFDGGLQILSEASEDVSWNEPQCQSLVLQSLFMSLVIGTKQSNFNLKEYTHGNNSVAKNIVHSRGLNAAKDSMIQLVKRLQPVALGASSSTLSSSASSSSSVLLESSGKRLGVHQQWRCLMMMRLIFSEHNSFLSLRVPNEDKNKQRRFKKRFELLLQILVGKSDLQSLCGWSLWSFALGQQGDMDSDDLYSSSEDGDEDESSGDARCSSSSFSSSSLSSSSSCSVLSLHVPSTNYHYVDANIWSF
jgi:hypothetical protein